MALEVLFRIDLQNGIVDRLVAQLSAAYANGMTNIEYMRGCIDTAKCMAIAIGADWPAIAGRVRLRIADDLRPFLDAGCVIAE